MKPTHTWHARFSANNAPEYRIMWLLEATLEGRSTSPWWLQGNDHLRAAGPVHVRDAVMPD